VLERADARARHQIKAIATSSTQKAEKLIESLSNANLPNKPAISIYTDYSELYRDPEVDIVYVGTPHALHKANCIEAIAAGKNVLCEKPLAINEKDAAEIVAAAEAKGVFLMEGRSGILTPSHYSYNTIPTSDVCSQGYGRDSFPSSWHFDT
jgi:predicted dehydrogenase